MKFLLVSVSLFLVISCVRAQNLVPNPSFEIYSACPELTGDIHLASGWTSYLLSPDYFNACANATLPQLGTPLNARGHQWPHTGNAYAGVVTFLSSASDIREAVGAQLIQSLTVGEKYYITFFISKPGTFNFGGATNNFGVKLSTTPYSEVDPIPMDNISVLRDSSLVTDTLNWTKITGSFVSDSPYAFISLGNFYDDANTAVFECPVYAYYYIDDICLTGDSLFNASWTGISQFEAFSVDVYPNPANAYIRLEASNVVRRVDVYDIYGGLQLAFDLHRNTELIDISMLSSGLYFIVAEFENTRIVKSFSINRL